MNNSTISKNQTEHTKKAEKYVYRYLNELKIHFNMSDNQLLHVLNCVSRKFKKSIHSVSWWKTFFSKK